MWLGCQTAWIVRCFAAQLLRDHKGQHVGFLAPLVVNRKGVYTDLAKWAKARGNTHLRVDGEFSDDSLNIQQPGDLGGHHMRFFPVRDASGAYVPNTFLMSMDFSSINFDYNDHVFLVTNVRPVDRTDGITGLTGTSASNGIALDWGDVDENRGYYVYRSDKASGTYTRITADLLTSSEFTDTTAKKGKTYYYRITAMNSSGKESVPGNVDVKRA